MARKKDDIDPMDEARALAKGIVDDEFGSGKDVRIDADSPDEVDDVADVVVDDENDEGQADQGADDEGEEETAEGDDGEGEGEEDHLDDADELDEMLDGGKSRNADGSFLDADGKLRNKDGTFAEKTADGANADDKGAAAGGAKPGEKPAEGAVAEKPADKPAEAPAPQWKPLGVTIGKELQPIPEALFTEVGEHFTLAIKKSDMPRFMSRMSKGVIGEKMYRDLQTGLKELELERGAPRLRTDDEIAHEVIAQEFLRLIDEVLTPEQKDNLDLRIQNAQNDHKLKQPAAYKTYMDAERAKLTAAESAAPEAVDAERVQNLADELFAHVRELPEFKDMSTEAIKRAYDDLLEIREAVIQKGADGWTSNRALIVKTLRQHATQATAAAAPAPTPAATPDKGTTAAADAGTPATAPKKPTPADRFNKAVDTAVPPRSTSLKDRRGTPTPRRGAPPGPVNTSAKRVAKTAAMSAEDAYRKKTQNWQRSDTLDMPDDEDDDDE